MVHWIWCWWAEYDTFSHCNWRLRLSACFCMCIFSCPSYYGRLDTNYLEEGQLCTLSTLLMTTSAQSASLYRFDVWSSDFSIKCRTWALLGSLKCYLTSSVLNWSIIHFTVTLVMSVNHILASLAASQTFPSSGSGYYSAHGFKGQRITVFLESQTFYLVPHRIYKVLILHLRVIIWQTS